MSREERVIARLNIPALHYGGGEDEFPSSHLLNSLFVVLGISADICKTLWLNLAFPDDDVRVPKVTVCTS